MDVRKASTLLNRDELLEFIDALINEESDSGSHTLCHIDIDKFRVVNHGQSMAAGNELLHELATLLFSCINQEDKLAWLYGGSFAIFLKDCAINPARHFINRIQDEIKEFRFHWNDEKLAITVSIGAIQLDSELFVDAASTLMLAEDACRSVKSRGGNAAETVAGEVLRTILEEQRIEANWVAQANLAFEEDRFLLYYQPIMNLNHDGGEKHYELLIRMLDNNGELVPPGLFLPAAEKYELGVKIDKWVIETATSWIEAYSDLLEDSMCWGINLSGQSLASVDLHNFVFDQFERKGIPYESVYFEITETAVIGSIDNALRFIDTVHKKGGKVALDDFGAGLSSFAYLKTLPVDYLKIDGLFVKNILEDEFDLSMVKAMKDIASAMGKQTIAEYVENDEVIAMLKDLGIDFVQGYGIAKPSSLSRFAEIENLE